MTKVSELLALKIENTVLRLQQLQSNATALQSEQSALIEQARAEVGAVGDYTYDLNERVFKPRSGPRPLSAPSRRMKRRAIG